MSTVSSSFYGPSTRISARLTLKRLLKAGAKEESTTRRGRERDDKEHSAKKKKRPADENETGQEQKVEKEKEESYRSLIQKNIAEKMAFLESLGVDELKVSVVPPRVQAPAKPSPSAKKPRQDVEPVAARKSLRLQNKPALPENHVSFYQEPVKERVREGPLNFKEVAQSGVDEGGRSCLCEVMVKEELSQVALEPLSRDAETMLDRMMNLQVDDTTVQKVVPARITAMVVHPSLTATLVFAGDKLGNFGFLKLLYRTDPDVGVMHFDWMLDNTMIVAHASGQVSFLDTRAQEKRTGLYQLHSRKVRTINAHPMNSWWFLTGSVDTTVKLWDSRMMSRRSPVPLGTLSHNRSCSAAFLSPVEGSKVVSTSFDDTIRHNNMTGRWLSPLRAVWMPGCDELFLVGSMEYPRRIEVYSSSGTLLYKFMGESLASVCSLIDVHPERLIIAGGNSSGKLHVLVEP
ncbi:hypothetical protein HPB49_001577 [Dermacentor silvarum]|uniref:Uncharacterized protein n=1 Tax=Dermacentor silvarum TaxID=543639 RepID=A0ACB8DHP8_DERSI|nr:hypothetical protein HPB49_001577 [Dermacentor silvarum]